MRQVAERVPDPRKTTIVGDSMLYAGETPQLAERLDSRFVALVGRSTNARDEAIRGFRAARQRGERETVLEKESRTGEAEAWCGCSVPVVDYKDKEKEVSRHLRRTIVVESSGPRRQKQGALAQVAGYEALGIDFARTGARLSRPSRP
ncbi:MAG: hypothetical protein ACAI25_10145 [Planctomycetota bacterium]